MPSASQYFGTHLSGIRPTLCVKGPLGFTTAGQLAMPLRGVMRVSAGATVAGQLKQILSVTGRTALTWLGVEHVGGAAKTHRLRLLIDGIEVYDQISTASSSYQSCLTMHGAVADTSGGASVHGVHPIEGVPLLANESLIIQYASSLTEAACSYVGYIYYGREP